MVYLITGKAGAGKTHYSKAFAKELEGEGYKVIVIDGDEFRDKKKNQDFTDAGRIKNLIDAAILAKEFEEQKHIVLMSFIAPKKEWRDMMREYWQESKVIYLPGGTLWPGTTYDRPKEDE